MDIEGAIDYAMGGKQSKIDNPATNVINQIGMVDHTSDINSIWIVMLILTIITFIDLLLKIYIFHKRSLRKKYSSRTDALDKV